MGTLKWYKRDPRAALMGMMFMTVEERGAYNTVLDLIYLNDGRLRDDEAYICKWMNVRRPKWRRLRIRLLELGKIFIHNGEIRNEKADDEAHYALKRIQLLRENSDKRWSEHRRIKGLVDASRLTPITTNLSYFQKRK